MNLEEFLIEKLSEEKVTLINPKGIEYTFTGYEPRHETIDFVFKSKQHGLSQFPYQEIKNWEVKA